MAFGSIVLGEVRGVMPDTGIVFDSYTSKIRNIKLQKYRLEATQILERIAFTVGQNTNSNSILEQYCGTCPFQSHCLTKTKNQDSLSLLSGISAKEITKY